MQPPHKLYKDKRITNFATISSLEQNRVSRKARHSKTTCRAIRDTVSHDIRISCAAFFCSLLCTPLMMLLLWLMDSPRFNYIFGISDEEASPAFVSEIQNDHTAAEIGNIYLVSCAGYRLIVEIFLLVFRYRGKRQPPTPRTHPFHPPTPSTHPPTHPPHRSRRTENTKEETISPLC